MNKKTKNSRRKNATSALLRTSMCNSNFKNPMSWSVGGSW